MVELPGSLERSTLGDLLGALHRSRVTGSLRLEESAAAGGHRHAIHWRDGLICAVETSRGAALGWPHGAPRHRDAERWTLDDADKQRRLTRLEALFGLRSARISFRVMGRQPPILARPLEPSEFLHGRRRQRDGEVESPASAPFAEETPVTVETPRQRALRTLGLSGSPGPDAVRAAFRQMALRWHPDRYPGAGDQTRAALCRRFAQISNAYEQLIHRCA